jgi:hypothetical protein
VAQVTKAKQHVVPRAARTLQRYGYQVVSTDPVLDAAEFGVAQRRRRHSAGHTYPSVYGRMRWDQPSQRTTLADLIGNAVPLQLGYVTGLLGLAALS